MALDKARKVSKQEIKDFFALITLTAILIVFWGIVIWISSSYFLRIFILRGDIITSKIILETNIFYWIIFVIPIIWIFLIYKTIKSQKFVDYAKKQTNLEPSLLTTIPAVIIAWPLLYASLIYDIGEVAGRDFSFYGNITIAFGIILYLIVYLIKTRHKSKSPKR